MRKLEERKMNLLISRARAQTKNALMIYIALLLGFLFFTPPALKNVHAENTFVTIGTGGVAGHYYHTGKAIAKIVNSKSKKYGLQVKAEFTGASVFNVNAMMMGDLEFGIVQSDRQYQAWHGIKDWKDRGAQNNLRSICSFYPESVVLVAADDAGIKALPDLKGKLVNIGNLGSGARGNAIDAMQSCGLDWRKGDIEELTAIANELKERLDAYTPFSEKLVELAEDFDFEVIVELVSEPA
jgi:TRAP transporter TAXI family solute receptor